MNLIGGGDMRWGLCFLLYVALRFIRWWRKRRIQKRRREVGDDF